MKIIGQNVSHKMFGIGTINEFKKGEKDSTYISVAFDTVTKTFQYPISFEKFLVATDAEFAKHVANEIEALNAKKAVQVEEKVAQKNAADFFNSIQKGCPKKRC